MSLLEYIDTMVQGWLNYDAMPTMFPMQDLRILLDLFIFLGIIYLMFWFFKELINFFKFGV